jgi:hypothetical protein
VGKPINVAYQRLQHPSQLVASPIAYVGAKHAMTGIKFSTEYRGKAFAVATFADGNSFGYYDGSLMMDFVDGLILEYMVNDTTAIAAAIAAMVDRQENYSATSVASAVTIVGPSGLAYDTATEEDAAGSITTTKSNDPTDGILGRQAIGSFRIVAGSRNTGVNKIVSVEVGPAVGPFVVITAATAVDWLTSQEITAGKVAESINSLVTSTDYTATAEKDIVTIKALSTSGDTPNDYVVRVTAAGDVCIGMAQYQVMFDGGTGFTVVGIFLDGVDVKGTLTVLSNGTPASYALAIATAINAFSGTYLANANGSYVSLSKKVTRSDDADVQVLFDLTGTRPGHGIYERDTYIPIGPLTMHLTASAPRNANFAGFWYSIWTIFAKVDGGVVPYQAIIWKSTANTEYIDDRTVSVWVPNPGLAPDPDSRFPGINASIKDSVGTLTSAEINAP